MTSSHHAAQYSSRYPPPQQGSDVRLPSLSELDINYSRPRPNTSQDIQSVHPGATGQVQTNATSPDHAARHNQPWGRSKPPPSVAPVMAAHSQHPHQQQHTPPLSAGYESSAQKVEYPKVEYQSKVEYSSKIDYPSKHDNGGYMHPGVPLSAQMVPVPGAVTIGHASRDDTSHSPGMSKRSRPNSATTSATRDARSSHNQYAPQYAPYQHSQPPTTSQYHQLPPNISRPPPPATHAASPHELQQQHHPVPVPNQPSYGAYQHSYIQQPRQQATIHSQHPSHAPQPQPPAHNNPYPSPGPPPSAPPPQGPWAQQVHPQPSQHQHHQQVPPPQGPPPPPPQQQHVQHPPHIPAHHQQQPPSVPTPSAHAQMIPQHQHQQQQHHQHQQQPQVPPPQQPQHHAQAIQQQHQQHHPQHPQQQQLHQQQHQHQQQPQHPQQHQHQQQQQQQPPPPPPQVQQQPHPQQLPFAPRTTALVPMPVEARGPYATSEPERVPSARNDVMAEIIKHCSALFAFASRYAQIQQSMPNIQPKPEELVEMSHRAAAVVRLLEDFRRANLPETERKMVAETANANASPEESRPPKRPWEDMSQDGGAGVIEPTSFTEAYPATTSGDKTTAEQDMEIIRTKRATSAAGGNSTAGQPKSKYRKRSLTLISSALWSGQRATPPGKCHSCNIRETPEWRRGPDGARTLCNACGLHYAKLMRKRDKANPNGDAPRIDMETLRASAKAAETLRASTKTADLSDRMRTHSSNSRTHQSMEPPSPMETSKPPPQQAHQSTFQVVTMMQPEPVMQAMPSEPTRIPPPAHHSTMQMPPPPPWATTPSASTSNGRSYAADHIQHQSFMRTSQHPTAAQASPR
ncbi:hypothetical protein BDQ12DRAFT_664683 [Crucibulum laeve]|uniref:GATA-type domain-containing protein n=1 Tax=Crucibulum laeve TaxID=68775 RepID=A0A5C3M431_9AGAR|nr:hypothetical protein BDQ12DRAFT_664683 [Crucibulum laeve]